MGELLTGLEAEYCPPLDSAVVSAIALDYDLTNTAGLDSCRAVLDQLKESASLEEAADFDPSGTGGNFDFEDGVKNADSYPETETSASKETDLTSLSARLSSLGLDQKAPDDNGNASSDVDASLDLDGLDEETKVRLLQEVFGDHLTRYSIQHTLRKCQGKWQTALEELLNHVYFNEDAESEDGSRVTAKGIDAFTEDQVSRRGRKGKKPKNQRLKQLDSKRSSSLPSASRGDQTPEENIWRNASKEISFIADKIGIAKGVVSSTYYANGASMPRTIAALLKTSVDAEKLAAAEHSPEMMNNVQELCRDFPSISPTYVAALLHLTSPSTAAAHELAKAMTTSPKQTGSDVNLVPQYVPLDAALLDGSDGQSENHRAATISQHLANNLAASPSDRAASYAAAQSLAFAQARAAHRKAKSDRLMGSAAAYYGQTGREYSALAASANATVADNVANAQSSPSHVDLHGIDVVNAVRIARERVEAWWDDLGESRVNGRVGAADRQAGFRIVVGRGVHSEGGKRKVGPAVAQMLRTDGWRFEDTGAAFLVRGKNKK